MQNQETIMKINHRGLDFKPKNMTYHFILPWHSNLLQSLFLNGTINILMRAR